ncbi:hypothetical protein K469DRAFT_754744 [Zopfia rhizophila CBS 207.26]|uniref:Uncharacterized protein n=1 Tax=Zopfia rhizophila CBS 207.26 TaxID=1314779 RepID=A0A6A6DGT8_9PEZI|nr:hypothetical protein K469DRAFT_754744 [Zopfia rhizophila CBS 207.26]
MDIFQPGVESETVPKSDQAQPDERCRIAGSASATSGLRFCTYFMRKTRDRVVLAMEAGSPILSTELGSRGSGKKKVAAQQSAKERAKENLGLSYSQKRQAEEDPIGSDSSRSDDDEEREDDDDEVVEEEASTIPQAGRSTPAWSTPTTRSGRTPSATQS